MMSLHPKPLHEYMPIINFKGHVCATIFMLYFIESLKDRTAFQSIMNTFVIVLLHILTLF